MDVLFARSCYRVIIYQRISDPMRAAYLANSMGRAPREIREYGERLSGDTNLVRMFLASWDRAFLPSRMHLPARFGISSRGVA